MDAVEQGFVRDLEDFTARLAKLPLRFHPGDRYEYSFSTDVLGRICEVVSGQRLDHLLRERLFAPLGMHDTGFSVPDKKLHRLAACYSKQKKWELLTGRSAGSLRCKPRLGLYCIDGARPERSVWRKGHECKVLSGGGIIGHNTGGLVSTVADTVKFLQMLRRGGTAWNGSRVITRKSIDVLESEQRDPAFASEARQNLFGCLEGPSGHEFGWGGAACTYWSFDRVEDNAIVWFTQYVDLPEWEDQDVVHPKKADIWDAVHKGAQPSKPQKKTKTI